LPDAATPQPIDNPAYINRLARRRLLRGVSMTKQQGPNKIAPQRFQDWADQ
jgi:hypothetical protein